jgi:putative FmdB family regulatory protein
MPLYEYKCDTCGQVVEVLETNHKNRAEGYCKNCEGERKFTKLFSLTAAPQTKHTENIGMCGEPRGSCGGGSCGCASH